jgi:hypothetical protein
MSQSGTTRKRLRLSELESTVTAMRKPLTTAGMSRRERGMLMTSRKVKHNSKIDRLEGPIRFTAKKIDAG